MSKYLFQVQTHPDYFELVRADMVDINAGSLIFTDVKNERLVVAYAPGQWITVHEDDDE